MNERMPDSARDKRHDLISLLTVLAHMSLVLAPLFLFAISEWTWLMPVLWLWFGAGMNGLVNLMHECAHYHVFKSRWGSDFLGHWVLGPLALTDFDDYRKRHWEHHRHLGTDEDPKYTYHMDIRGARVVWVLLRCLSTLEAVRKFTFQLGRKKRAKVSHINAKENFPGSSVVWVFRTVAFHAVFFSLLLVAAIISDTERGLAEATKQVVMVYAVYLYGLSSLTVFFVSLRAIAEHQIGSEDIVSSGQAVLRNFSRPSTSGVFMGAYGFSDHATHREMPAIPYYRLGKATRDLARAEVQYAPVQSYASVLWDLIWRKPPNGVNP